MQFVRTRFVVAAALAALVAGCGSHTQSGSTVAETPEPTAEAIPPHTGDGPREIQIAVTDKGFVPAQPAIHKGEAVTLVITRKTDFTCATNVMFPRLAKMVDLPLNQAVRVDIPAGTVQDTLYFACGMNMIAGQVTAR